MGGEPNGEGYIDAEKLIRIIKDEFEMTIDIEKLINDIDEDGSGQIEYDEFRNLLSSSDWLNLYLFLYLKVLFHTILFLFSVQILKL